MSSGLFFIAKRLILWGICGRIYMSEKEGLVSSK